MSSLIESNETISSTPTPMSVSETNEQPPTDSSQLEGDRPEGEQSQDQGDGDYVTKKR